VTFCGKLICSGRETKGSSMAVRQWFFNLHYKNWGKHLKMLVSGRCFLFSPPWGSFASFSTSPTFWAYGRMTSYMVDVRFHNQILTINGI